MKTKRQTRPGSEGFTLIEIMVTLGISMIVMGALIEVFSAQNKVYYQQTQLANSQAAARAALFQLARDVRMAGYTGIPLGSKMLSVETINGNANYFPLMSIYNGDTAQSSTPEDILAVSGGGSHNYVQAIIADLAALGVTSDALEIRGNFARQTTTLSAITPAGESSLPVTDTRPFEGQGFNQPGWVAISQSGALITMEIYPFDRVSGSNVVIRGSLRNDYIYPNQTTVCPIYSRVYYATPNDPNLPRHQRRRLWVANYLPDASDTSVVLSPGSPVELAVDIENFQVWYDLFQGVQGVDFELTLNQRMVCDPCQIRAVTLSLWTIADKYRETGEELLRQFSTTVQTRNLGFESLNCPVSNPPCASY